MNEIGTTFGKVTPPKDMMEAARASLSDTGFANLMERTGGRAPTAAELVEFADNERLAGVVPPYETIVHAGDIVCGTEDAAAAMAGESLQTAAVAEADANHSA